MGPYIVIGILTVVFTVIAYRFQNTLAVSRDLLDAATTRVEQQTNLLEGKVEFLDASTQVVLDFMGKSISLIHWEACVLAKFFEKMGIEFNWRDMGELGPEHFEAFANERPKFFTGLMHTIEVEMHAVADFSVDARAN
jgi:hypothetical protein